MKRILFAGLLICLASSDTARAQDTKSTSPAVDRCEKPFGTIAVNEPDAQVMSSMGQYGLKSPSDLLRMMIEDSNCFVVVERGSAMKAMQQERQMAASGDLQKNANIGKGQLQAADCILTPKVVFSQEDSGGDAKSSIIGVIGKKIPGLKKTDLKFHEALTSLIISDVRTGVQVAAAEGKATSGDLKVSAFGFQSASFTSSSEGKVIAESLLKNFNAVVAKVRGAKGLDRTATSAPGVVNERYGEGAILAPKMDGLPLLGSPDEKAAPLASLKTADNLLSLGEAKNGFLHVQRGNTAGWVRQSFLAISESTSATAADDTPKTRLAGLEEGSVVRPKIDNVKLLAAPQDNAAALATLKRTEELVYLGEEKNGFVKLQGASASGWVKLVLLSVAK